MDECSKGAMEKTKKGQASTGPVRKGSTAKRTAGKGGPTNGGGIAGNWTRPSKAQKG